jgi:hypothetical protein
MGTAEKQYPNIVEVILHVLVFIGIDVGTIKQSYFYNATHQKQEDAKL